MRDDWVGSESETGDDKPILILHSFLFKIISLFLLCKCFAYMHVCLSCVYLVPVGSEEGTITSGTGVTGSCEPQ